MTAATY
jgi:hypothetical protein